MRLSCNQSPVNFTIPENSCRHWQWVVMFLRREHGVQCQETIGASENGGHTTGVVSSHAQPQYMCRKREALPNSPSSQQITLQGRSQDAPLMTLPSEAALATLGVVRFIFPHWHYGFHHPACFYKGRTVAETSAGHRSLWRFDEGPSGECCGGVFFGTA